MTNTSSKTKNLSIEWQRNFFLWKCIHCWDIWPKFTWHFVWPNYLINCQNPSILFSQLIESYNNGILGFKKVLINWQKRTDGFWQLIEIFLKLKIPLLELLINWKVSKNSVKWWNMKLSFLKLSINWILVKWSFPIFETF